MAIELAVCAFAHSPAVIVIALGLGGFGNGIALVHDRLLLAGSIPASLHGRLFSLQRMCVSIAFTISFVGAGALITAFGVRYALFLSAAGLVVVSALALRRLRTAWPAPAKPGRRASLGAHGEIAQLVEHTTENRGVPGSSPGLAIAPEPCFAVSFAEPESRLIAASLYVAQRPATRRTPV